MEPVNFIKHLFGWHQRQAMDRQLNAQHCSLYMALFWKWNACHFQNPIDIVRAEMMQYAHIGSHNTYLRCLKKLHHRGYLEYRPSYHALYPSTVVITRLDNLPANEPLIPSTTTTTAIATKTAVIAVADHTAQPSNLDSVKELFHSKQQPVREAEKFYAYYQARGWRLAHGQAIQDWRALAHTWILNTTPDKNTTAALTPGSLHTQTLKNYDEPF